MKRAKISGGAFNRIVNATKAFSAKVNSRSRAYEYIRIEFDAEKDEAVAVALDGHRLSAEYATATAEESFVIYIKGNVKVPNNSVVTIELIENEAIFRCDGYVFGFAQPEGEFMDWRSAIPSNSPTYKIGFNGDYLLSALQAAKASVGGTYKTPVVLEFRNNT
jgi:DNA polymerase III sliding clamp (beta) subunit (PCNA family)